MNRKLILLFVFALGMVAWSCSKDDSEDVIIPSPINDVMVYSYGITAPAGSTITLERTMKLADFTALNNYQKYVYKGTININSFIEFVKSSSEDIELKEVILQVKNNSKIKYNLGTLTDDVKFSSLDDLNFMQLLVNELVSKKEIVLQLSFASTNAITDEVELDLNTNIKFDLK